MKAIFGLYFLLLLVYTILTSAQTPESSIDQESSVTTIDMDVASFDMQRGRKITDTPRGESSIDWIEAILQGE